MSEFQPRPDYRRFVDAMWRRENYDAMRQAVVEFGKYPIRL